MVCALPHLSLSPKSFPGSWNKSLSISWLFFFNTGSALNSSSTTGMKSQLHQRVQNTMEPVLTCKPSPV
eukprot:2144783-Amphidinium_carterae.1